MKRASEKANCKNMITFRLSLLCLVTVILGGTSAFALDPLGPPVAEIQKWQLNMGLEYSLSSMDIELTNGSWTEKMNGVDESGQAVDLVIRDFESDKVNAYFGYGIGQNWEAFVRLGAVNSEFGHSILDELGKFDSDYAPSVGIGLRMTLIDDYYLKIGAVAQAGWAKHTGQINPSQWLSPSFVTMDLKEAQIAIGALYRWTEYISIYGGPFYHYVTGELEDDFLYVDSEEGEIVTSEFTWDIESSSDYGGYLGTRVELGKNFYLNFEYQMTGNADSMGAGIIWKY